MTHKYPTVAEHVELGRAIKAFERELYKMITGSTGYPVSSRETKAMLRVSKALKNLRSIMDSNVCAAIPRADGRAIGIYYGADVEGIETDKGHPVPPARR